MLAINCKLDALRRPVNQLYSLFSYFGFHQASRMQLKMATFGWGDHLSKLSSTV